MTRAHLMPVLALSLLALACTKEDDASGPSPDRTGGTGGTARGGASGSGNGGATGSGGSSSSSGGATGSGGSVTSTGGSTGSGGAGSGGTSGSGGVGGTGGSDAAADAPRSDTAASDATGGGEAGAVPPEETLPNKPWIRLCPKAATQTECCEFLCQCLDKVCANSPRDKLPHDSCMNSCAKLNNMQLRCRVYHCYESQNRDYESHCGHASGRVGGGGCPAPVYQ